VGFEGFFARLHYAFTKIIRAIPNALSSNETMCPFHPKNTVFAVLVYNAITPPPNSYGYRFLVTIMLALPILAMMILDMCTQTSHVEEKTSASHTLVTRKPAVKRLLLIMMHVLMALAVLKMDVRIPLFTVMMFSCAQMIVSTLLPDVPHLC